MSAVHQYVSSSLMSNTYFVVSAVCSRYPPVVCTTPFGFPVVPLVYRMYSGCSESTGSAGHTSDAASMRSCHQWSRPACIGTCSPVRRTTTTEDTVFIPAPLNAPSTFAFSGTTAPRRYPPSAVTMSLASASFMRSRSASELKPPNTTLWVAPMRVQASMVIAASGIIGM
jgi:hypothetical protein